MQIGDDLLDLRELRGRMDDLQTELDDAKEEEGEEFDEVFWSEEISELKELKALFAEVGDPEDEPTLILEHYFEQYARELAEDIYGGDKFEGWPFDYIDWAQAAEALEQDYTSYEIDGYTYLQRS